MILTHKSTPSHSKSPSWSGSRTATMSQTCTFPNKQTNLPKRITSTMSPMVLCLTFLKKTTNWPSSPVLADLLWESMEKPTLWVHSEKMERRPESISWLREPDFICLLIFKIYMKAQSNSFIMSKTWIKKFSVNIKAMN